MSGGALPIISMALQAGGQAYGGAVQAGQERQAAAIDAENARLSLLAGEQDVLNLRRAERRAAGDALTEMAASGSPVGTGSAADVIAASAAQAELDIAARRRQAMGEQANYLASAAARRSAAKGAMIGGLFSAVSTAVAGAANIRNQKRLQTQAQWQRAIQLGGGKPPPLIAAPGASAGPWRYGQGPDPSGRNPWALSLTGGN